MSTEVNVYTTPSCPYCVKIKQWLNEEEIEYSEHNVANDQEKAKEMIQKTGQRGVPQTIVKKDGEETAIVGFQPQKIKQLIEE